MFSKFKKNREAIKHHDEMVQTLCARDGEIASLKAGAESLRRDKDRLFNLYRAVNDGVKIVSASCSELHGIALDLDAQVSETKRYAQQRAADAILRFHELPGAMRMNRADRAELVRLIAFIADEI